MRENRAEIELVCTWEREGKTLLCGGQKRGRRERGRNVAALLGDLLHACVVLLLAHVNSFYTLHKTNRFVQSFVLSFVRRTRGGQFRIRMIRIGKKSIRFQSESQIRSDPIRNSSDRMNISDKFGFGSVRIEFGFG